MTLTNKECCDVCTAKALTRVQREGSGPLYFCGHHYNYLCYSLAGQGWRLTQDERPSVVKTGAT